MTDSYIFSPSVEHLILSKFILILALFLHLPFMGMLLGGSFFSVVYNLLSKIQHNKRYSEFSKLLIDSFTFSKLAGIILGVLPLLAITLVLPQLLYKSDINLMYFLPSIILLAT